MDTNVQYQLRETIAYFEDAIRKSDAIIDRCSPQQAQELTDQKQPLSAQELANIFSWDKLRKDAIYLDSIVI